MAQITILNPATGEQQAIDDSEFDASAGPYAGWEKIADGLPLADLKAVKLAAIDARLVAAFVSGFTPSTGPIAGHTLQTRPPPYEDRTNWLTSQAAYLAEVSAGNGAVVGATFRDVANETIPCSFSDGLSTLLAMAAWGQALYANSWSLKDQVRAASDEAALDAIDVTAGWPQT